MLDRTAHIVISSNDDGDDSNDILSRSRKLTLICILKLMIQNISGSSSRVGTQLVHTGNGI